MLIDPIGPLFCVLECDIALSGYITSLDTKLRSYILYIGPINILYILHIYIYRIKYNIRAEQRSDLMKPQECYKCSTHHFRIRHLINYAR